MKKLLLSLIGICLILGLVFYFFTLQTFQFVESTKMKMHGVTEVNSREYVYFEKNNCSTPEKCQCVLLLHGLGDFALTWEKILSMDKSVFVKDTHFFAPNLTLTIDQKLTNLEDYNVQRAAGRIGDYFLPKCESWVVVGNSFGGWEAVFMALKSEKVKGLLLLGAAGMNKNYSHITSYFINPDLAGAKSFYRKLYYKTKNVPDFIFQRIVERIRKQTVLEQLQSVTPSDFLDNHLGKLRVPVSFVWGEADQVIPAAWAPEYQALTPNSTLGIIKECGHVPQKECPTDVVQKLNELLNRL